MSRSTCFSASTAPKLFVIPRRLSRVDDATPESADTDTPFGGVWGLVDSGVVVIVRYYLIPYFVQSCAYVGCGEPATVGDALVHSAEAMMTLSLMTVF